MKTLPIVTHPTPSLRERSKEVDPETIGTPEFQAFCDVMVETMFVEDGVGLAAPQVGHNIRVIVVNENDGAEVFINPEIIKKSDAMASGQEGCLSVPGVWGMVERHKKVTVRALTRHNRTVEFTVKGFDAVKFQHEIDHIDGVLFIDKATEIVEGKEKLDNANAL